jgi:hypothetical protein
VLTINLYSCNKIQLAEMPSTKKNKSKTSTKRVTPSSKTSKPSQVRGTAVASRTRAEEKEEPQKRAAQKSRGNGGKASTTKHAKVSKRVVNEGSHSASASSKVTGSNKWVRSDNKKQPKLLGKSCFRIHVVTFEIMCMNFDNLILAFKADPKKFLHNTIGIRGDVYHGIYRQDGDEEWMSRSITITSYAFTTKADLDAMRKMLCELCTYAESSDNIVGWGRKTEYWVEE